MQSHLFVPCGHVCACSSCASRIMETTQMCPIWCMRATQVLMFVNIFVVCMCLFVNVCVFLRHMCMCLPGVHICEQYVQLCVRVLCASDAFAA